MAVDISPRKEELGYLLPINIVLSLGRDFACNIYTSISGWYVSLVDTQFRSFANALTKTGAYAKLSNTSFNVD
ncbi:hypothetical protein [Parasediminibacterium sp. JCM 36343]|uniref:hypothetical protein n=1 Tax=Parasediminibacterium sp. JCM 36343 TaxID=3374279 RepID=UPI003978FC93